jgi:hypothetical protein
MSYSYITSVFPKFEYSNVYDANLYNNISGLNKKPESDIKFSGLNEASQYQEINKKYTENFVKPAQLDMNLEMYKNIENTSLGNKEVSQGAEFLSQNNKTYYNKPLPANLINSNNSNTLNSDNILINKTELQNKFSSNLSNSIPTTYKELDLHKESFSQSSDQNSHETYTKHILECEQCKEVLLKQFNIETDRIRNQEILELITFLIFGLFILLLLDGLKK